MSYTYYQAKNQEDQVTESELPIRLQTINSSINALEQKTDKISRDGDTTTIPNIVTADIQIRDNGPDSSMRISTIEGQAAVVIRNNIKSIECYGALTATNITSNNKNDIESLQDKTQNIIRIPSTDEGDPSYTEIDGVSFQTTLARINNIEFTLSNVSYDPMLPSTDISGNLTVGLLNGNKIGTPSSFIYNNYSPFIPVCDASGIIEVGGSIDFHELTNEQDYRARLSCIGTNILELAGTASMRLTRIDVSVGMTLRSGNTLMKFTKSDPAINMLTLDATTDTATFLGNIVAPNITTMNTQLTGITETTITKSGNISGLNLTGISYNNNLLLQSSDYTTATVINNHLHVNLNGMTYKPLLGIRAHKDDLANDQEVMIQVGKNHSRAISFVYKNNDIINNSQYRLDFAGRTAYICTYGATKTEHEIKGNLKVFGTITENASKTITHYTMYEGEDIKPGCFVESTGKIYRDPESKLSPYEDCISIVKLATDYNNNVIGVCTEVLDEEIKDEYENIIQPAGKYLKYATHGDVLIKCVSATYTLGDILIPTTGGYAKKANNMEIIDAMTHMIPRLKVTSVETETIDSETVCAFITL